MKKEEFSLSTQTSLALRILRDTGANLFLTGKAGTGKTTFLRQLKERCPKRMIVVAPTGVAANTVPMLTATGTAGQAVVVNEGANGFAFANLLERSSGTITGNGTTTSFPIEHELRGPPVGYVIVNDTTKKAVQAEVTYTDDETITVAFNTAPATGTNYTVYMVG